MRLFRMTGTVLIGAAALVGGSCKERDLQLRTPEAGAVKGDEQSTGAGDSPISDGLVEPLAGNEAQGLSLATAAELTTTTTTTTTSVVWKLEKRDRFNNLYKLDTLGNLYRFFGGTLKCQVTNMVLDFKINLHPADESVAYLVRNEGINNGVLYALMDSPTYGASQCPKSFKIVALSGLTGNVNDKYKIVSNLKDYELGTTATMMSINGVGDLVGWRGRAAVFRNNPLIKFGDLVMNVCYGSKAMSFSSYVGFVLEKSSSTYKRVLKIKGRNTVTESKWDTRTWASIQDFKAYYKVCDIGTDTYPTPPPAPIYLSKLVDCSSDQYRFAVCDAGIGTGFISKVSLYTQYSVAACTPGISFGSDSKAIWTSSGCRGKFRVTYVSSYYQ